MTSPSTPRVPVGFSDARHVHSMFVRERIVANMIAIHNSMPMPRLEIRCGLSGGLPFDFLMTDVVSGCLPVEKICYGNCSAAEYWIDKGHDFGRRTLNSFDASAFRESALALPNRQRWLRQGWASDCSFSNESWSIVAEAAEILAQLDISLLVITKAYVSPSIKVQQCLADCGAEIRASISAIDSEAQLARRLALLKSYREIGGKSVPYLMTSRFDDPVLARNQDALVEWIVGGDFIAGEHPLRFSSDNRALKLLDKSGFWHPKFPDQYWFGRLYAHIRNFVLPPPTHLLPEYTLRHLRASELPNGEIQGTDGNLPTLEALRAGVIDKTDNLNKHATYGP